VARRADPRAGVQSAELLEALRALAPSRRLVIVLHYWLDLSIDEISALLTFRTGRSSRGSAVRARSCGRRSHVFDDLERQLRDVPGRFRSRTKS
jgi:hypothetical protein